MNQLAHVVLRNALDDETDPFVLRAAELFYRPQRVAFHEGAVLLADTESIEGHERERRAFPLIGMLGGPAVAELGILDESNAAGYFARSAAFEIVIDLTREAERLGLAAALTAWVHYLIEIRVELAPSGRGGGASWCGV